MEYTSLITLDDMAKRGYDLLQPGKLEQGAFPNIEAAADDFMQECFDAMYNMIERHNGWEWTKEFFSDMSKNTYSETTQPISYNMQQAIKWALKEHAIFIYDNGDKNASAKVNNDVLGISPKAIEKLYNSLILR